MVTTLAPVSQLASSEAHGGQFVHRIGRFNPWRSSQDVLDGLEGWDKLYVHPSAVLTVPKVICLTKNIEFVPINVSRRTGDLAKMCQDMGRIPVHFSQLADLNKLKPRLCFSQPNMTLWQHGKRWHSVSFDHYSRGPSVILRDSEDVTWTPRFYIAVYASE